MALASTAGGVFKVDFSLPGSESERAFDILKERGFGDRTGEQGQIVFADAKGVDDPQVQGRDGAVLRRRSPTRRRRASRSSARTPQAGARQIARDGTIAYAEVNFTDRPSSEYPDAAKKILDLKDADRRRRA